MARRTLTDAWGDRWDVEQEIVAGPTPVLGPLHFRHQTGWRVIIASDRPMNALNATELLLRLEAQLERDGQFHSVTRGVDIKKDPDGYTSLDDGSDEGFARPDDDDDQDGDDEDDEDDAFDFWLSENYVEAYLARHGFHVDD